eukprot:1152524-Pelagomonas_calceolata.AAC.6
MENIGLKLIPGLLCRSSGSLCGLQFDGLEWSEGHTNDQFWPCRPAAPESYIGGACVLHGDGSDGSQ